MQCYSAFASIDSNDDDTNNDDDKNFSVYVTVLLIVVAFSCFMGGAAIAYCATHYYINNRSLKEPLLEDVKYGQVNTNDNSIVDHGGLKPVV